MNGDEEDMYKYAFVSYDDSVSKISFKLYNTYHEAYFNMKAAFDEIAALTINHFTNYMMQPGEFDYEEFKNCVEFTTGLTKMHIDNIKEDKRINYEIIEIYIPDDQIDEMKSPLYMLLSSDNINWSTDTWMCGSYKQAQTLMKMYFDDDMRVYLRNDYDPNTSDLSKYSNRIEVKETENTLHMYIKESGDNIHYEIVKLSI